ncbi:hypothetical protein COL26b_010647 [Colletotrichum chrysophilum]|uniref:uncharacterized protein n=1 Tax=Colletotrichum chrysophilum TaxID=1836956 RepID=UPI002301544D|nr:uncharacterized protein COL26b_010647 [Colletotrichum chrysophilum]KAJ0368989.1 hypothetical protein COL26b_010647 [Colletotrichum chrysophilum]
MDAKKASIEQDENPAPNALKPSASNPTPEEWAQHFMSQDEAWHKDYDKKLLVKVDRRLMPTLVMMYLLNFLDRSNLAQARQGTLEADLGMSGTDFNLATSIFFVVAMWILPDYPHTTKWLSEEERAYAAWRLIEDIQEADTYHEQSMWGGVKMAVRDYRLYIFILMQHLSLVTQTFQYFFPTIVGTLGYGKINTLWLTAPCWAATFLISVCVTYSSSKTRDRSLHIFCLTLLSGVGNAIATGSSVVGVRYFAMFLMPMGAISACELHQHIA